MVPSPTRCGPSGSLARSPMLSRSLPGPSPPAFGNTRLVPRPRGPGGPVRGGVPVSADPDTRFFFRRPAGPCGLDEYSAADAAQLPALLRPRAAPIEAAPLGLFHRLIHQSVRVAAVVDGVRVRRLVGKSVLRDEIATA